MRQSVRLRKSIKDINDAYNTHSDALCTDEPDMLKDGEMLPRIGDEYQAEISAMHPKNKELDYADTGEDGEGSLDIQRDEKMGIVSKLNQDDRFFVLLPETSDEPWSGVERDSFLLGLHLFGKNFSLLKRTVEGKTMGCILFFYYGKFYGSDEHQRWAKVRKLKGRESLVGERLLNRWRREELQSRLYSRVSEECQKKLIEVSRRFEDGNISFEEYIFSLKSAVDISLLIEAVGEVKQMAKKQAANKSQPQEEQPASSSHSDVDFESSPGKVMKPKKSESKLGMKRKKIQKKSTMETKKINKEGEKMAAFKPKTYGSDQQKEAKITMIRTSPKVFADMVSELSEAQKKWVRQAGFGCLLDFSLKELPHKFGYNVLKVFDHASVTLRLTHGNISITEQDVADVLGLPIGHRAIKIGSKSNGILEEWRAQFTASAPCKITAGAVCNKIKESREVTLMFKMNFLVIMMNTFVESLDDPYVSQRIINFQGDVDDSAQYNWCALVIDSLADSKPVWQENPSKKYYTGPLVFLILLYVDRVLYKARRLVDRRSPTFIGWTDTLLLERQADELESNSFGRGKISKSPREEALVPTQAVGSSYNTIGVDSIEKDCLRRLKQSASDLVIAITECRAALRVAKTLCPENPRVKEIESELKSMIARLLSITGATQETANTKSEGNHPL